MDILFYDFYLVVCQSSLFPQFSAQIPLGYVLFLK